MKNSKRIWAIILALFMLWNTTFVNAEDDVYNLIGGGSTNDTPVVDNPIHSISEMYKRSYSDESIQSTALNYRLYVPADYDESKEYPLLVYLNGAGSRGTDNTKQLSNLAPFINPLIDSSKYSCIVVVPQLPTTDKWVNTDWTSGSYNSANIAESNSMKLLMGLLTSMKNDYSIDSDRLYIVGQSMGGYGTWDALIRYPNMFAAAIPMCGAGDPSKAADIATMPILVMHGDADPTVPVSGSREMVAALNTAGSNVTYLEYAGDDHYIQRRIFEQSDIWLPWLFAQKKGTAATKPNLDNIYNNTPELTFNFNTGINLPGSVWSIETATGTANWDIVSQALKVSTSTTTAGTSFATVNSTDGLTNGMVSGFFTLPANFSGGGGLVLRYQDNKNYIHIRFLKNAEGINNGLEILEMVNGSVAVKKSVVYPWITDQMYCLKAVLKEDNLKVYLDNLQMFDYTITSINLKTGGKAGLRYYNGSMTVDDFVIATNLNMTDVTISEQPADRQVIQRNPETETQNVTIKGNYSGAKVDKVQVAITDYADSSRAIVNWTDSILNNGSHQAIVTVPQGGWYRTNIRLLDHDGKILMEQNGSNRWGVGMNILCIGQSNMVGMGKPDPVPFVKANDRVSNFANNSWKYLVDPYDPYDNGAGGSMTPTIGNILVEQYNVPVGFIPAAKGGVSLMAEHNGWGKRNTNNPYDTSTLYGTALSRAKAAGGIEFIIMNQGENDVSRKTPETAYKETLLQIIQNFRSDLNFKVPFIYCQLGAAFSSSGINVWSKDNDPIITGIRSAQLTTDNGMDILMGVPQMDLERNTDNLHYTTLSQTIIGTRIAKTICYYLKDADYYKAPTITGATFASSAKQTIDIRISHAGGTDFTPTSEITGFEVFDGTTAVAVTSAVRKDATTIRLTLDRSVSGNATLRYLYGCLPNVTNLVKDNSALALPLYPTTTTIVVSDATTVNNSALKAEIARVQQLHNDAQEGLQNGDYHAETKTRLQTAIATAQAVADNEKATQVEVDNALAALNEAVTRFRSLAITPSTGDISITPGIEIGDLDYAAHNYGKNTNCTDWNTIMKADINGDGKIGLYDLVFIARRIVGR